MIMGVDEAGRGPVIGPMVVCGAAVKEGSVREVESLGVKDSKKLSPKKREELSVKILEICRVELCIVDPAHIDARVVNEESLNELEVECFSNVIKPVKPLSVYLDACDVNAERFGMNVRKCLGFELEVISAHGADVKYPIVSAASIVAKVHRDMLVRKISDEIGEDVGSGYPADPVTMDFLKSYYKKHKTMPGFVRKTWKTSANVISDCLQSRLDSY